MHASDALPLPQRSVAACGRTRFCAAYGVSSPPCRVVREHLRTEDICPPVCPEHLFKDNNINKLSLTVHAVHYLLQILLKASDETDVRRSTRLLAAIILARYNTHRSRVSLHSWLGKMIPYVESALHADLEHCSDRDINKLLYAVNEQFIGWETPAMEIIKQVMKKLSIDQRVLSTRRFVGLWKLLLDELDQVYPRVSNGQCSMCAASPSTEPNHNTNVHGKRKPMGRFDVVNSPTQAGQTNPRKG